MNRPRSRIASAPGIAWLLWFALLLPIAQYVATSHALSHSIVDARGEADAKQPLHQSQCDLCPTAAAVSGAALPAAPPPLPLPAAHHAAPQAAFASLWLALPALAYLSRAPPLARL